MRRWEFACLLPRLPMSRLELKQVFSSCRCLPYFGFLWTARQAALSRDEVTLPWNSDTFLADIAFASSINAYLTILMKFLTLFDACWTLLNRAKLGKILFAFGIISNNHLLVRLKSLAPHIVIVVPIFIGINVIVSISILADVHQGSWPRKRRNWPDLEVRAHALHSSRVGASPAADRQVLEVRVQWARLSAL